MGWEHAYATISSIGALSQCERPAGSFLVDLRGEIRFAGTAGAAGAVGEGGVTLAAGTVGLPGAGGGAILAARRTTRIPAAGPPGAVRGAGGIMAAPAGAVEGSAALAPRSGFAGAGAPGAAEGAGGNIGAGTTGSLAAGPSGAVEGRGAILVARTLGLRDARPPRALVGAGVIVVAATTGLSGAGPPGGVAGGGIIVAGNIGLAGAGTVEGRSATLAAGITGLRGARPSGGVVGGDGAMAAGNVALAGGCGGSISVVAGATGLSAAGSAGGIDGIRPFRHWTGISAGFSKGGATLMSAPGFGLGAVSLRGRFGLGAAARGAFAFPGLGAVCLLSLGGNGLPRRSTPGGSSQIHFTAPLPPSVRIRLFSSRRGNSSITQRLEKPVCLARSAISIWRPPRLGASALGAGINWINTRYRVASASGMAPRRNSRLISDMRSPPSRILADLDHRICFGLAWLVGSIPASLRRSGRSTCGRGGESFRRRPPARFCGGASRSGTLTSTAWAGVDRLDARAGFFATGIFCGAAGSRSTR
jgi:hypothetical protein